MLSEIVAGASVFDCTQARLTYYGAIADKYIRQMDSFYSDISVDNYVIMPNHIHLLICITTNENEMEKCVGLQKSENVNSKISRFVSTFKRFCNKEYGENIWQSRFYDHVIRGEKDYREVWEYIENNPAKWLEDKLHPSNFKKTPKVDV